MNHDTKASILGAASCACFDFKQRRMQADVDEKGHPFSYSKYFSGTMVEARRLLGLGGDKDGDNKEEEEDDDDSESADDEIQAASGVCRLQTCLWRWRERRSHARQRLPAQAVPCRG